MRQITKTNKMITRTLNLVFSILLFSLQGQAKEKTTGDQRSGFIIAEPGLKSVVIDSDEGESFLGLQLDSAGRLFAGCREALFVYEPAVGGLYHPRQLLFRFPKHSWVYDIAIRGDDLYVSTHWAIYLLEGATKKREGIVAKRLVWGLPQMKGWDMHQGMHNLAIGPEGDIYFSNGDQIIGYGRTGSGVWDAWMHWTYFHGTKSTKVTGCGGVFRISPDGEKFSVIAMGTRNSCGISYDRAWNLFTSDNDHESRPKDFVPGRLLHVTSGAYFSWPRGWLLEKIPWRADMLGSMHPDVGRYVPTGMAYYDDTFLPKACRHSLYVAEWGRGKLLRYPLREAGASFKVEQEDFFSGPPTARPVGVTVGRGGRIFTSVCYMKGNEASPMYRSDIVMITRADDAKTAPFAGYEETTVSLDKLFTELADDSWSRRYRAHVELARRGKIASREAAKRIVNAASDGALHPHLLWLAAADKSELIESLTSSKNSETRLQALRALAKFATAPRRSIFEKSLEDLNPQVTHAALVALRERFKATRALPRVIAIAQSEDRLLRQAAVQLLAAQLPASEIQKLCESAAPAKRFVGILVAGQRLTIPPLSGPLPESWPLSPMTSTNVLVGETLEIKTGNFTMAEAWAKVTKSPDDKKLFALLERRLNDPIRDHAKQAAFFLWLLKDPRTEARSLAVLGLRADKAAQDKPLKGATSTGITELPKAFAKVDWTVEVVGGDAQRGAKLYTERGCAVCHAAKAGDSGSGGPALIDVGSRFTIPYLVEAIITPNKTVSPIFKWTMVTRKDGTKTAGLIIGENGTEIELLLPAATRQTIVKDSIAKREMQDRSPMPEGLITTSDDLRDLLAYLIGLKESE
jgi:putative heme-binding domain-containing protein